MNKQITFPILSNFCQDKQNINWLVSYWWSLSDITYLSENKKIIKDDNMIPILKSLIMLVCWFKSYDTPFLVCFVDAIKKKAQKYLWYFNHFNGKKYQQLRSWLRLGIFLLNGWLVKFLAGQNKKNYQSLTFLSSAENQICTLCIKNIMFIKAK